MTEILIDDAKQLANFLKVAPVEKTNGHSGSMPILKYFLLVGSPRRVEVRATDLTTTTTGRLRGRGNAFSRALPSSPAGTQIRAVRVPIRVESSG